MENKLTPELIEKAKLAKSAEELIALAKENGAEITAEEANIYFAKLNKNGEISDDELDSVSGGCNRGTPYYDGRPVVDTEEKCQYWCCDKCGSATEDMNTCRLSFCGNTVKCGSCKFARYREAMLLCYSPDRYRPDLTLF